MGSFKLGGMTLSSVFKKPETIKYPFEKKEPYAGQKGHVIIDESVCILCGICSKRCPAHAIEINKPERTWNINMFRCVQCGSCIPECPKNCISMEPSYPAPTTSKSITTIHVPERD